MWVTIFVLCAVSFTNTPEGSRVSGVSFFCVFVIYVFLESQRLPPPTMAGCGSPSLPFCTTLPNLSLALLICKNTEKGVAVSFVFRLSVYTGRGSTSAAIRQVGGCFFCSSFLYMCSRKPRTFSASPLPSLERVYRYSPPLRHGSGPIPKHEILYLTQLGGYMLAQKLKAFASVSRFNMRSCAFPVKAGTVEDDHLHC